MGIKRKKNNDMNLRRSKRIELINMESDNNEMKKEDKESNKDESESEEESESENEESENEEKSDGESEENESEEEDDESDNKTNIYIKMINEELTNPNLDEKDIKSLTESKYELEELNKFDNIVKQIELLSKKVQKRIDEEKLTDEEKENIEKEAMKKIINLIENHQTNSIIVNIGKKNVLDCLCNFSHHEEKNITKINNDFYSCYNLYDLPDKWYYVKDYFNDSHDKNEEKKLNDIYINIKKYLLSKYVSIKNILELDNISIDERSKLFESYTVMLYYKNDDDIYNFIKFRDKLEAEYNSIKNRINSPETEIQRTLIKINGTSILTINKMENDIFELQLDPVYKKIIYDKYIKMINLSIRDSDRQKITEWIENAISLPYNKSLDITFNDTRLNVLRNIKNKLDEKIYGLNTVKEEILLIINSKLSNPYSIDNSFCLISPPGMGKTKIIKILSEVLFLPFYQIAMGGMNDISILEGHSYTYIGSKPGKIIDALKRMKYNNGIIYLDEIDKIGKTHYGQEVSNCLLHITDFTQNNKYYDKYLGEISVDLSKIWFIFSCNNIENVDPILSNRIKRQIIIPEYTKTDKVEIIKKLLPEMCSNIKLNMNDIIISDDIISFVLDNVKQEKGLRIIIAVIENILKRIKLLIDINGKDDNKNVLNLSFYIKINKLPYIINITDTNTLLNDFRNKEDTFLHYMYT